MTREPISIASLTATVEEASLMMKSAGRGCLVVMEEDEPIGIITERDLVQKVMANKIAPSEALVSSFMSKPLVTVGPEASLEEAASIMIKHKIRRLIVVEGSKMVGILTVTDLARYLQLQNVGPIAHAMTRGASVLSEIENLPRQCPSCGSRFHVELMEKKHLEVSQRGGNAIRTVQYWKDPPGLSYYPPSSLKVLSVPGSVEYSYRCKKCGHEWSETDRSYEKLPEGISSDRSEIAQKP